MQMYINGLVFVLICGLLKRYLIKMCELKKYKTCNTRIDKCMRREIKVFVRAIELLKPYLLEPIEVVACCCGHGKYPKTIVLKYGGGNDHSMRELPTYIEHFSQVEILRKRKFYKRDEEGYYYIPEVIANEK